MIRAVKREEIPRCGEIIRLAFATVAKDFGITKENCPKHTSFVTDEKLYEQFDGGRKMFVYISGAEAVGFFALDKKDEKTTELNNLAVIPSARHGHFGSEMIKLAADTAREDGAEKLFIGIIDENLILKKWYEKNGFTYLGNHKFDGFPFTAGFMEMKL